jgi:ferredoxin-NADP reductase
MEEHIVKILKTEAVTHNVNRFILEKPASYKYIPGQATEICINKSGWKEERSPFTFTSLNDWDHLEFTIKIYNDHPGVTCQLGKLKKGDELVLHDIFGAINYHGEGTFIAGGAGITPFLAILRQLKKDNKLGNNRLIFSNRTEKDIILKDELTQMLGKRFINTLTDEKTDQYDNARIDETYLKKHINDFSQYFYVCGPDAMVESIHDLLVRLGADKAKVVIEQF